MVGRKQIAGRVNGNDLRVGSRPTVILRPELDFQRSGQAGQDRDGRGIELVLIVMARQQREGGPELDAGALYWLAARDRRGQLPVGIHVMQPQALLPWLPIV